MIVAASAGALYTVMAVTALLSARRASPPPPRPIADIAPPTAATEVTVTPPPTPDIYPMPQPAEIPLEHVDVEELVFERGRRLSHPEEPELPLAFSAPSRKP